MFQLDARRRSLYRILTAALLCGAIVVTSACASSQKNREEADLRLRLGTSMLEQGNYPSALRELLLAEKLDPKNEVVQNNLGLAYFLRDRFSQAAEHLERAIELKPTYSEARNNYARVLIELSRFDQAAAELERVIADLTYDDPGKAWTNLGLTYFRKGDFRTAKAKLTEAIKINRENCLAQTLYGRTFLELSEYQTAAKVLDNAVIICRESQYDEPHYYSGLSYYKLGRTSAAVARMEEVIKLYPEGPYAKKAQSLLKLMK